MRMGLCISRAAYAEDGKGFVMEWFVVVFGILTCSYLSDIRGEMRDINSTLSRLDREIRFKKPNKVPHRGRT